MSSSSLMVPLAVSAPSVSSRVTAPAAAPLLKLAWFSSRRVTVTVSASSFRASWVMLRSRLAVVAPAATVMLSGFGVA